MKKTKLMSITMAAVLAFSVFGTSGTALRVDAAPKLRKIQLNKKTVTVETGKKIRLKAVKKPKKAAAKLIWKTANKKVAKVSKKGVVTGIKPGVTTVTVKTKSGKKMLKAKCKVRVITPASAVQPPVEKKEILAASLKAKQAEVTINEGEVAQMETEITPADADNKKLRYSVSDPDVASVSETGVITAIAQGECEVIAETTDGSSLKTMTKVTVTKKQRPRAIITQDGEVDDMNSLVHMLLYANEIDIRGIIHSSSNAGHWIGIEGAETPEDGKAPYDQPYRWPGTEWMYEYIDAYAKVYPNLKKHDSSFPTPSYLRKVTKVGNIGYPGEMESSTDGSKLIEKELLADDDRPLYLMSWGGPNTISRALSDIKDKYKDTPQWNSLYQKIVKNTIITGCFEQDNTYNDYIAEEWPGIAYINAAQMSASAFGWQKSPDDENKEYYKGSWMYKNLDKNHGALLDKYVTWGDGTYLKGELPENQFGFDDDLLSPETRPDAAWISGDYQRYDFISEGDSPCWYMLIDNGLRDKGSAEALANGGYSGRYKNQRGFLGSDVNSKGEKLNYWSPVNDKYVYPDGSSKNVSSEWKWIASIQKDFAARADWCITNNYAKANHAPAIAVTEGVDILAGKGEAIKLHAVTSDPDNDYVTTKWSVYGDASTYANADSVELKGAASDTVSLKIPQDAESGDTINVIVQATDDGEHNLVHYQQVIITIK